MNASGWQKCAVRGNRIRSGRPTVKLCTTVRNFEWRRERHCRGRWYRKGRGETGRGERVIDHEQTLYDEIV
jgi:hypothetical protein